MLRQTGWRTLAYVGLTVGISLVFVVLSAIRGTTADVSTDFYAAAAQVIPVLLLAMFIRISGTRDLLVTSEADRKRAPAIPRTSDRSTNQIESERSRGHHQRAG